MKKHFISFVAGFGICFLVAMKSSVSYEPTIATAEVLSYEGFTIYNDCKPVKKYEIIGFITSDEITRNLKKGYSSQYTAVRDRFIFMALKQYSGMANGLILNMCDGCTDKATVIKIK